MSAKNPRGFSFPVTKLGPLTKVGLWTISLELRGGSARTDRAAAYRIAADLCDAFTAEGFDVRVVEDFPLVAVTVEVGEAADFPRACDAFVIAAGSAAARSA